MRKYLFVLAFLLIIISCDKKNDLEKKIEAIPVDIKIERFDKIFFETKEADLPKIKRQFFYFFPEGNDDTVWINKTKNPLLRELYEEVQKKYTDINPFLKDLKLLFQHIKYYFPEEKTKKVITLISEMDYRNKVIYTDSLLLISLDLYLGKEHKFYEFPEYYKQNFEYSQMMPDIVADFSHSKISRSKDRTLLSQMIYAGKSLYLKDLLLPKYSDADKIGYTSKQMSWCEDNEEDIWRYLIEEKLLYSTDSGLEKRFIDPAPFSKFYLEVDNSSPGRVGTWIGWQIVRSFMKNNDVSLEKLLRLNANEIFEKSKYKPKK